MALSLASEKIWLEKMQYDKAECLYIEQHLEKGQPRQESLSSQIEKALENIQSTLAGKINSECHGPISISSYADRFAALEKKQEFLSINLKAMLKSFEDITNEINSLKLGSTKPTVQAAKPIVKEIVSPTKAECAANSDSDEVDLFGSDDEEENAEAARVREERLKAYAEKKSNKPGPIAKSSVLLDVKPWDDETDMLELEKIVRSIEMDGLKWGAGKLVPLAFGIKKLSILCMVEDEKVSIDDLSEKIEAFEDLVQSVDIAAFNKI